MDWEQAYRDNQPEVFAFLYTRCGRNAALAEDLTQDTFVRAIRAQKQFTDDGRGVIPWLTTIARNLLADHFKSHRARRDVTVESLLDDWTEAEPAAEAAVMEQLTAETVMRAVGRLNPDQREAVVLSYWGRWPDERIGRLTGVTARTVNTRRFRAREILRRRLAEVA
jgi:RNA polymerase sigma-70 factor (ECF subfamily)